jgi:hypothetical protein
MTAAEVVEVEAVELDEAVGIARSYVIHHLSLVNCMAGNATRRETRSRIQGDRSLVKVISRFSDNKKPLSVLSARS